MCGAWLKYAIVKAMAASRKDCAANSLMLVTIHRCATMAICSTSTMAAIRVTILSPNWGSCSVCMAISKQERGHEAKPGQDEGHGRSEEHTSELQSLRHLVCR